MAGIWHGNGTHLDALRLFCLSWGGLLSLLVDFLLTSHLHSQLGVFFYLHFTRSVGLAAVLYKKKTFPVENWYYMQKSVFNFSILSLCSLSGKKCLIFFFSVLLGFFVVVVSFCSTHSVWKKKDPNSTIHGHVKHSKYFSWQAQRTSGSWEVTEEEEIEGDLLSYPLRSSSAVRLRIFWGSDTKTHFRCWMTEWLPPLQHLNIGEETPATLVCWLHAVTRVCSHQAHTSSAATAFLLQQVVICVDHKGSGNSFVFLGVLVMPCRKLPGNARSCQECKRRRAFLLKKRGSDSSRYGSL